jgi:hypothetical protein
MAGACQHFSLLGRLLSSDCLAPALHKRRRFAQHFLLSLLPSTGMAVTTSGRFWRYKKGWSKLGIHSAGTSRKSENTCAAPFVSRQAAVALHIHHLDHFNYHHQCGRCPCTDPCLRMLFYRTGRIFCQQLTEKALESPFETLQCLTAATLPQLTSGFRREQPGAGLGRRKAPSKIGSPVTLLM